MNEGQGINVHYSTCHMGYSWPDEWKGASADGQKFNPSGATLEVGGTA